MILNISKFIAIIVFASLITASKLYSRDLEQLNSPEIEISLALTNLENLSKQLRASNDVIHDIGIGPQHQASQRALKSGVTYFFHKEYLSAIREFENYLERSQVPIVKQHMSATHKLGLSYDAVGDKYNAVKTYLNFIASFVTAKDRNYDQLLDVMKHLMALASNEEISMDRRTGKLLASVASLELPALVKTDVLFLAAKTAMKTGNDLVALKWLDKSVSSKANITLKAQSFYFKALIEITKKNWDKAEALLIDAMNIDPDNKGDTMDVCKLALARISVRKNKPQSALIYYESVSNEHISKKDADFESIYLLIKLENFSDARNKAMLFVSRYPNSEESFQLKTLMAYLSLRAGNLNSAKAGIKSNSKSLENLRSWLGERLAKNNSLQSDDIKNLFDHTNLKIQQSPIIKEALRQFSQLSVISRKLSVAKGEVRNILYTIGRTSVSQFHPEWTNRAEQLKIIAEQVMNVGHRLIATERNLYRNNLTGVEKQKLITSEVRRVSLNSEHASRKRERQKWASLGNLFELTQDLAQKYDRVQRANADLAASRYLLSININQKNNQRIELLQQRVLKLNDTFARALELVRAHRVNELLVQSPHLSFLKLLSQYSASLDEESVVLSNIRDQSNEVSARLMAEDGKRAWRNWRFLTKELYQQYDNLTKDIESGITGILGKIDLAEDNHSDLEKQLHVLIKRLENSLGSAAGLILTHYNGAISNQLSRQQKWSADLEWMGYDKIKSEKKNSESKKNLEKQILEDNLQDLNQGVLWKWPE